MLHRNFKNKEKAVAWLKEQIQQGPISIYSSFDIRQSNHKVVNVDGNIYLET